jgi:hypothetical protein
MLRHRLGHGLKRAAFVAPLAALLIAAATLAPPAHASGAGHYQTNQGRWHTSIDISYSVDSGHITWYVKAKCWVSDYAYPSPPLGTDYFIACSLSHRPPGGNWILDDWQTASAVHSEPPYLSGPAAIHYFTTHTSGTNVTWAVYINGIGGNICFDYGDVCTTVDRPPNPVETDATT